MKFCTKYYNGFRYFDEIDEIILKYKNHNDTLLNFINEKCSGMERILIDITEKLNEIDQIIPILRAIQQEHSNIVAITSAGCYEELKENNIPYFFIDFCRSADEVYSYIKQGVSDVYIVEGLAFNLKEISPYCKEKNIKVRIFPNIAQYALGQRDQIPTPCRFFVRPEDIELYENYVDVCEFIAPLDRLSVLFATYKGGQWLGDLKDLITGLDEEFLNTGIAPYFAESRIGCRHKCMQEKCHICLNIQEVSKLFPKVGLVVKKERNTEWGKKR